MSEALIAWAKVSLARTDKYRDRSAEATSRVTSDCSLTKCVVALDELEDISDDTYGKAYEFGLEGNKCLSLCLMRGSVDGAIRI